MAELANCIRCDKLFAKTTRPICQDCFKEDEKKYQIVYNFLKIRKNREATVPEIVEETGVEYDLIMQFVKDKRLRQSQFPNIGYPCERCGKEIGTGKLCDDCVDSIQSDINHHTQVEEVKQRNEKESKKITYFTRD
ncbi:flagellar operon protein TIGR03826 [Gracilibacillus ureilyticus]|uniref:Flagellar operon protein TIGR03826 n=2 Tax=Gracilibacillus ureilyticus TaxID=531814 RepID=A0A1H9NYG3_9BACI|nr:TIGR03826 family flagellar region protein [Gracilibacillus ureilyticus]SER40901.1 flagellar operon protein TIGR03826 [Gracilibacillus ureilyticus]